MATSPHWQDLRMHPGSLLDRAIYSYTDVDGLVGLHVPMVSVASPVAVATPAPELEPLGVWLASYGLST